MQQHQRRKSHITLALLLLTIGIFFSLTIAPSSIVSAQVETPTPTPRDPIWLGFSAARTAIEEEEGVNLSLVRRWEFWQDDWGQPDTRHPQDAAGIDSCVSTTGIALARPIYFGWTYVITALNGNVYEARVSFDLQDIAFCDILSSTATAAADDTSDEGTESDTDLPAPAAGAGATGSFELGGHATSMNGAAIAVMQRAGMSWYKVQLPVAAGVQQGLNQINAAHAAGFKILLGVVGDHNALEADPAGYAQTYGQFVAALASGGADAIEVWNEPNLTREWPLTLLDGASYTEFLAVAYNAIKNANSGTMVISAALAPTGFFGAAGCGSIGCNDDHFMQQMANAGAANYADCIGAHYNEGIVSPGTFSGDPRGEFPTYYFGSMTNRVLQYFPGRPVCYTELGYLSPEGMGSPLPGNFGWAADTSVAEHAAWLADAAARAAQRGDIRIMIVWNVDFQRWDTDPMGGYAMLRPDGSCPACDTLGAVMGG